MEDILTSNFWRTPECHDNQLLTNVFDQFVFSLQGLKKKDKIKTPQQTQLTVATVTRHAAEHGEPSRNKKNVLTATNTGKTATATNTGQSTYNAARGGEGGRFERLLGSRSHSAARLHHL